MTNYEKYKTEIDTMCESKKSFGLKKGKICSCHNMDCGDCKFNDGNCRTSLIEWLLSEYEEPKINWNEVEVDTPILVRNSIDEEWHNRYFAKYENNLVYTWNYGCTSWSVYAQNNCTYWNYAKLAERGE